MDLANLKPVERIIDIVHPSTGEKIGVSVTVLSINDEKMAAAKRRIQNKKLELDRRGKTFKADDLEENEMELLTTAITGWNWEGDVDFHGEKPAFNEKNVKAVLKELTWFKEQIMEAVGDEKAFFQH
jgi:hypothetical protein